ncbi:MAG: hypothetical protein Q8P50_15215 [Bacillota bacterium]|nr:hypothetical protein [Bacillota bacterium]
MTTQAKRYVGDPYWERERPRETDTAKVRVSYFPEAGKLQIAQLFTDRDTGEAKRGRTVTLDQEDLTLHPAARALILEVLEAWREP